MNAGELLGLGIQALTRNRMRSALTVLGIVIGVAAVIATLAIGQGAREAVQAQIRALGANVLNVIPGTQTAGGVRTGMGGVTTLTADDALAIQRECPSVAADAPVVRTAGQVVYGAQNWGTQIQGTTPAYVDIRQWPLDTGTFFTDPDVRGAAKVCVLGQNAAQQLFADANPVGSTIRIKDVPFRVLGVLIPKGGQVGPGGSQDDIILVPYTTAQTKLAGITYINSIVVSAASEAQVPAAQNEINDLLRQRHRIRLGADQDFMIFTQQEIASSAEQTSKVMTLLLASIAAVSLLVGGIGIMNIMLVSVTERTREIGIRMAIGATEEDVQRQFLIEAVVLSMFGGLIGILLGITASKLITSFAGWAVVISPVAILAAAVFSMFVGIFFGFYPARKAARLDPIEALRYE